MKTEQLVSLISLLHVSLVGPYKAMLESGSDYTVPGRTADVRIKGTNRLIRNGAVLVGRTEHVLQAIEPQLTKRIKPR